MRYFKVIIVNKEMVYGVGYKQTYSYLLDCISEDDFSKLKSGFTIALLDDKKDVSNLPDWVAANIINSHFHNLADMPDDLKNPMLAVIYYDPEK